MGHVPPYLGSSLDTNFTNHSTTILKPNLKPLMSGCGCRPMCLCPARRTEPYDSWGCLSFKEPQLQHAPVGLAVENRQMQHLDLYTLDLSSTAPEDEMQFLNNRNPVGMPLKLGSRTLIASL